MAIPEPIGLSEKELLNSGVVRNTAPDGWSPQKHDFMWNPDFVIRPSFLSAYIRERAVIDGAEIKLDGVCISTGVVDIENCRVARALDIRNSEIKASLYFANTTIPELSFTKCRIEQWLHCSHMICSGNLFIVDSVVLKGPSLSAAAINGSLLLSGSSFTKASTTDTIYLQGIKIGQSIIARQFNSDAEIYIRSAHVEASIQLSDSIILSNTDSAIDIANSEIGSLQISNAKVGGAISLNLCHIQRGISLHKFRQLGKKSRFYSSSITSNGPIRINKCRFDGGISLTAAKIHSYVEFDKTLLGANSNNKSIMLDDAKVDLGFFIFRSRLVGELFLASTRLDGDAHISQSTFYSKMFSIMAPRLKIGGSLSLGPQITSRGMLLFEGLKVQLGASLTSLKIEREPALRDEIWADINFKHAEIGHSLDFEGNVFCPGSVHLSNALIKGDLNFSSQNGLPNTFGSVIAHSAYVGNALFMHADIDISHLDLRDAKIKSLIDAEEFWPPKGQMKLDRFEYTNFGGNAPTDATTRIRWLKRQSEDHLGKFFRPRPFEQLAFALKNMGYEADAREVQIEKQILLRKAGRFGGFWPSARHAALGILIGYGFRPINSVVAAAILIFSGWIWFNTAYFSGYIGPSRVRMVLKDDSIKEFSPNMKMPPGYPSFDAFAYSVDAFLPVLDLQQETYWVPRTVNHVGQENAIYRWYYWVHTVLGWIVTTIGIAGFTGLIKRD